MKKKTKTTSKAAIGAKVEYCGHRGNFIADIYSVAGALVVRANGKIDIGTLDRINPPTHHVSDFPVRGFWRPDLGVFVVPEDQVTVL